MTDLLAVLASNLNLDPPLPLNLIIFACNISHMHSHVKVLLLYSLETTYKLRSGSKLLLEAIMHSTSRRKRHKPWMLY